MSPVIDPRFRYRGEDVVETLEKVCGEIGYQKTIRVDNGSELISHDVDLWAYRRGITLDFSRPGRPKDNAFILRRGKRPTGAFPDPSSLSTPSFGRNA